MRPHPLLLAILAVLPSCSETLDTEGCVGVADDATTCPAAKQVPLDDVFLTSLCGDDIELVKVKGEGRLQADPRGPMGQACCYTVEVVDSDPGVECAIGRPFLEGTSARLAPVLFMRDHTSARQPLTEQSEPTLLRQGSIADPIIDRQRAEAWAHAGAGEHASIAAFSRLSLQLMALGAPLDIVEGVQRAALEEVHHARACWKVAQTLSGAALEVGAFPFERAVDVQTSLAELAYAAVREGCLAETLGACVTQAVAPYAMADVRDVVTRLADEEADHAVLSFRIVSWALQVGGQAVRDAVSRALSEPWPSLDAHELAVRTGVNPETVTAAARSARKRVLEPAARALLS